MLGSNAWPTPEISRIAVAQEFACPNMFWPSAVRPNIAWDGSGAASTSEQNVGASSGSAPYGIDGDHSGCVCAGEGVQVLLGRGDAGVAHSFLHDLKIRSGSE